MKRHDGAMTVASVPDVGTTFDIYLPASVDTPASDSRPAEIEVHHAVRDDEGSREKVLVLDDDQFIRDFVAKRTGALRF